MKIQTEISSQECIRYMKTCMNLLYKSGPVRLSVLFLFSCKMPSRDSSNFVEPKWTKNGLESSFRSEASDQVYLLLFCSDGCGGWTCLIV